VVQNISLTTNIYISPILSAITNFGKQSVFKDVHQAPKLNLTVNLTNGSDHVHTLINSLWSIHLNRSWTLSVYQQLPNITHYKILSEPSN